MRNGLATGSLQNLQPDLQPLLLLSGYELPRKIIQSKAICLFLRFLIFEVDSFDDICTVLMIYPLFCQQFSSLVQDVHQSKLPIQPQRLHYEDC